MCTNQYMWVSVNVLAYTFACVRMCAHVHEYMCMDANLYARTCECLDVFVCTCSCIHVLLCTFVCVHAFACTQVNANSRGACTSVLKENRRENRQHILITKSNVSYNSNTKESRYTRQVELKHFSTQGNMICYKWSCATRACVETICKMNILSQFSKDTGLVIQKSTK